MRQYLKMNEVGEIQFVKIVLYDNALRLENVKSDGSNLLIPPSSLTKP